MLKNGGGQNARATEEGGPGMLPGIQGGGQNARATVVRAFCPESCAAIWYHPHNSDRRGTPNIKVLDFTSTSHLGSHTMSGVPTSLAELADAQVAVGDRPVVALQAQRPGRLLGESDAGRT